MAFFSLKANLKYLRNRYLRRVSLSETETLEFQKCIAETPDFVRCHYLKKSKSAPVAIIVSGGYLLEIDIVYAKCLEVAGYLPVVLMLVDNKIDKKRFRDAGIRYVDFHVFSHLVDWKASSSKPAKVEDVTSYDDIKKLHFGESIKVGMNALATFLRETRGEKLDFKTDEALQLYGRHLEASCAYASIAKVIVDRLRPELMLMNDRVYSPVAELFQLALNRGIRVITRNASQATGFEILKAYKDPEAVYTHPHSLSRKSWEQVRAMPWSEAKWQEFDTYMRRAYLSGDWFAEVGTQFNKSILDKNALCSDLNLDINKPTAVVFSHIFWDGTLSYGVDLFDHYCDWFTQVAQVAKSNTSVNWIFKVHPANLVKANREGIAYESAEFKVLESVFGTIPEHVKVLESDSDISTYSLFAFMDYCLTVRGTIGIESAAYGVRTLTAGTGRYDRLGFTLDFDNKAEYLETIRKLEDVPAMSESEITDARRFAWAVFKMRHLEIEPLEWTVERDDTATQKLAFNTSMSRASFQKSRFASTFAEFLQSGDEDILVGLDE